MIIRTLAISASLLLLASGGAFAQAAPGNAQQTCAALNAMPEADRLAFAQEYIDSAKGEAGGDAALRNTQPELGAAPNQAGEPGKASGGPKNQAADAGGAAPAGVTPDDAVQSFKGIDAAGLVGACASAPDKTFVEVMPIIPAPAGQ